MAVLDKAMPTASTTSVDPNSHLESKVQRLILKAENADDDDPVLKAAAHPKLLDGVVRPGFPVYVPRSRLPVCVYLIGSICLIAWSIYDTSVLTFVCCVAGALIGYDLFSGFLHIVLDNPANLHLPIIGQPCLEFQMHHHFPTDIVQRDFFDVLGDLNTVAFLMLAWTLVMFGVHNPMIRLMGGLKLIMAYYGQFSHRSAHTPSSADSTLISGLRSLGLMIPLEKHRSHHRAPHDTDFCLVGMCNPLINFLYGKVTRNRFFWMAGFFGYGLFGIMFETMVMERLLGAAGVN